jgi:hypothetical protein
VLGIKEKLDFPDYNKEFETISETEKIYKKII